MHRVFYPSMRLLFYLFVSGHFSFVFVGELVPADISVYAVQCQHVLDHASLSFDRAELY